MIIYCNKFKDLVLDAYNKGTKTKIILETYKICRKTLYNWRMNVRFVKFKPKNISDKYSADVREYIVKYVINNSKFNIKRLLKNLRVKFNTKFTNYNIYYILKKLNITYKKAKKCIIINKKKHNNQVKELLKKVKSIGQDNIISVDESHYYLNMSPNYGWNYSGEKVTFENKTNNRLGISLITAISNNKVICSTINRGSVNSSVFIEFMKKLNRKVKNKSILVDNAPVHRSKKVKEYMKDKSHKFLYNVPYNPKTNPIEQVFNKSKICVKQRLCDTFDRLIRSINYSLKSITSKDLSNFYKHSFGK